MIKKKLKKWYPTKKQEDNAILFEKLQDAANHIHRTTLNNSYANWFVVGSDVATQLDRVGIGHDFCGTTRTYTIYTTATTQVPSFTVASASTYFTTSTFQ